jgi:hypothetical protein
VLFAHFDFVLSNENHGVIPIFLKKVNGLSNVWSQPIPSAVQAMADHYYVMLPMSNI